MQHRYSTVLWTRSGSGLPEEGGFRQPWVTAASSHPYKKEAGEKAVTYFEDLDMLAYLLRYYTASQLLSPK